MGLFKKNKEERAEEISYEDSLLVALFGSSTIDKNKAMEIPSFKSSVNFIANTISSIPIKLYKYNDDGKVEEVKDDIRVKLLNQDTGDTLTATQMIKAMVTDYLVGKGGYVYINKVKGKYKSLHYIDETYITIQINTDHIFKDYSIMVDGKTYLPYDFLKIIRNTKDGASGKSLIQENNLFLSLAYASLIFESALLSKGGNKKGFLKSSKKLSDEAMKNLKTAWANLYANNSENMMVLNDGLEFQETSATSVEMQLNEQKITNSTEMSMLMSIPNAIIRGNATEQDEKNFIKRCLMPIFNDIECSLDRDLLLEKEKTTYYWAFDLKELTRGSLKERYEAYKLGIEANVLQIDEARQAEDLEQLDLDFIKLNLADVLYNPKTKEVYTPNTNATANVNKGQAKEGNI